MVSPAPNLAEATNLTTDVAAAMAELDRSIQLAGLGNDPIGHAFRALSTVIGLFPKLVDSMEATRQPFAEKDLRRLQDAASSGAATGAQRQVSAMVRSANWRTLTLGAIAFIASVGGAYWLGRVHEAAQYIQTPAALGVALTGPDAAQWVTLMRLNDINNSRRDCTTEHGGVGCSFSFWTKPAVAGQ